MGLSSTRFVASLWFIPKGWQRVAGGRNAVETPGMQAAVTRILKGCQKVRVTYGASGIPSGCVGNGLAIRGSSLRSDPRLLSAIPLG